MYLSIKHPDTEVENQWKLSDMMKLLNVATLAFVKCRKASPTILPGSDNDMNNINYK